MNGAELSSVRIVDADGNHISNLELPSELPSDLTPGQFLLIPEKDGSLLWYIVVDKSHFWDGHKYKVGATIDRFDPGTMTEKQLYAFRRKSLKRTGWI